MSHPDLDTSPQKYEDLIIENPYNLTKIPLHERSRKLCEMAVSKIPSTISFVPLDLKEEFYELAAEYGHLQYIPLLELDRKFAKLLCELAMNCNGNDVMFIPLEFFEEDKDFGLRICVNILQKNIAYFDIIPDKNLAKKAGEIVTTRLVNQSRKNFRVIIQ